MLSDNSIIGDLLFPNEKGEQLTQKTWRKSWYRYCAYNDIPQCTPYEIRHTYVSINKNLPEGLLRGLVGHSKNMDTFGTYGHEFGDDAQKAAALVEQNLTALIGEH